MQTLKAILRAIGSFFAFFLPIVKNTAEKVAPEIQREIDRILNDAKVKVDGLTAKHSIASIQKQMEDDITAARETAEQRVVVIRQRAQAKVIEISKLLPVVDPPPNPPAQS